MLALKTSLSELKFGEGAIQVIARETVRASHSYYNKKFERLPKIGFSKSMIESALGAAAKRSKKRKQSGPELARVLALSSSE